VAGQTLRARDVSSARLRERLERAAVTPDVSAEALAVLQRTGLVDDARFAGSRAAALADRGYGDAAIRLDLERQSVAADLIAEAVGALDPEIQRARELVSRRGEGPRTARYVAGRGFGEDAVSAALGDDFASDP
jgi:regulatory protein